MANPGIIQGTINRLRASVTWPSFPQLNVTASFLGEEAIRLSPEGPVTTFLNTLTGGVTSPEPYQLLTIRINLLKTQSLANAYKLQIESNALLGDGTIRPDATPLSPYPITNAAIESVEPLDFGGKSPSWIVTMRGYYNINQSLWG